MLCLAASLVHEGATTAAIDAAVHAAVVNAGAYPSPLLYQGSFPKSICTSVNNVMAHGIPDEHPLQAGDILNIDVTVYLNGFHGDCSAMFAVGQIDQASTDLIAATRSALDAAIAACEPGAPFSVIADAIGRVAAEARFAVSPDMCGHGIGRDFHCAPIVHHVPTPAAGDLTMEPGMAFTIEPILCQGSPAFVMWPDAWTVVTKDGGRSAQYEETLLVTEDGIEIVTKFEN
ncbi:methionine aminopeptidase, type I [Allomyces macrogynus ATCC 38327]|uniref:Methionine aminopeptidase n=1 Tax=Allomyces macrogynus (strain ATCC 38327) TaxID=578462 RepID=A0A0L0S7R9_ALLM3|nr:methionine aminopeptidase, type I [Allomyces macrogynus ATCC 38327]|eukprot:KNE58461.1 methionine aminopeptidase, type I [Allomyces macrogynus ATCC 38327]